MLKVDIVNVLIKKMPKHCLGILDQQNKCAINHYLL